MTPLYHAALNVGRSSHEKAVCPSVCLSNACIVTKRKEDLSRFFIPYERSFGLVFRDEERLVGATLLPEISPYFVFSPNSIALQADNVTVFEGKPIISVKCRLSVPFFHFCQN